VDQVQKRVLSNLQDLSTLSCGHDGWNVGVHRVSPPNDVPKLTRMIPNGLHRYFIKLFFITLLNSVVTNGIIAIGEFLTS
jgi:hypothetical protein